MNPVGPLLAFDVYGTLVDPASLEEHLRSLAGEGAHALSRLWRGKQLEYAFRRGLMEDYVPFSVCTRQALEFACASFGIDLGADERERLMQCYLRLPAFADAAPGLERLQRAGAHLVAFSNGTADDLRQVLTHARLEHYFERLLSVEVAATFKPSPRVYDLVNDLRESKAQSVWMISANPWDVIGASAAGLSAAWLRRDSNELFDPWGVTPDCVVPKLGALVEEVMGGV